jgi:hypothetical protein
MTVRHARHMALAGLTAGALLVAGCGEDDESDPPPPPRPQESVEKLPKLPRGWTPLRSSAQGLALGSPPGWREGSKCFGRRARVQPGAATTICSPDRLVSVAISADRTIEAVEVPLDEFASRALSSLSDSGFGGGLEPGRLKNFKGRYVGVRIGAAGRAKTGVMQRVDLVVLRRDRLVTFTAVIAANAKQPTAPAVRLAERSLRTLRSRPVAGPAPSP